MSRVRSVPRGFVAFFVLAFVLIMFSVQTPWVREHSDAILILCGIFIGALAAVGSVSIWIRSRALRRDPDYAAFSRTRQVFLPIARSDAVQRCLLAVEAEGALVEEGPADQGTIKGRFGATWRSFGERLEIVVLPEPGGSSVEIRSWSSLPFAATDFGKNRHNVESLAAKIADEARS
jgi:hypothetical protein